MYCVYLVSIIVQTFVRKFYVNIFVFNWIRKVSLCRCGLGMDSAILNWIEEVNNEVDINISQPLYLVNTCDFQWKENVQQMMSLCKAPDASGKTPCRVLTLE